MLKAVTIRGTAQQECLSLEGLRSPLPRGLYKITFDTAAESESRSAQLLYKPASSPGLERIVQLFATINNGEASAVFVMPEPAHELALRSGDQLLLAAGNTVRLRRLSSRLNRFLGLTHRAARLTSNPVALPALAARTLRRLRRQGLRGLTRSFLTSSEIARIEGEFDLRYRLWAQDESARLIRERPALEAVARTMGNCPKFSIIMPVFDPPVEMLKEAIDSVFDQIWPHWELCVADDASTNPTIRQTLEQYSLKEPRIKITFRTENRHICEASNSALELATGDWIVFLDHDDRLSPQALLEIARTLEARPNVHMIYSDEDKIDREGKRCQPYFKPDWNPELLLSYNVVNHLACFRRELVQAVGGLRLGFEGAQDYDLVLRISERLAPHEIIHIPQILYHWRMHKGSTASNAGVKPYAMKRGEMALNDHFTRTGEFAEAKLTDTFFHVAFELPRRRPFVSIIIATRDRLDLLSRCINSIIEHSDYQPFEIVVMDNGSREERTLDWLNEMQKARKIRVIRDDRPFNYSALNNAGVDAANGELVLLLNNDIEVLSAGWLSELVSCMRPGVGAVGAKLLYPDRTVQHAGLIVNSEVVASQWFVGFPEDYPGSQQRLVVRQAVSVVTGACLLTRKSTYLELDGLDEENLAVSYNDVDYCLKILASGQRVVLTPFLDLIHHESASRGKDNTPAKSRRLYAEMAFMKNKWGAKLDCDPMGMPGLPRELGRPGHFAS